MDSFVQGQAAYTAASLLLVNLHDKLAACIDVATVHSCCVKWQRHVALVIDCDQSTGAAKFGDLVQSSLRSLLERQD